MYLCFVCQVAREPTHWIRLYTRKLHKYSNRFKLYCDCIWFIGKNVGLNSKHYDISKYDYNDPWKYYKKYVLNNYNDQDLKKFQIIIEKWLALAKTNCIVKKIELIKYLKKYNNYKLKIIKFIILILKTYPLQLVRPLFAVFNHGITWTKFLHDENTITYKIINKDVKYDIKFCKKKHTEINI